MNGVLRLAIGAAGLLLAGVGVCAAQQGTGGATITINAAHRLGPVNRLVFGDNVEAGDSKHVFGDTTNLLPLHTGTGFWDDQALRPVPFVVARMKEIGLTVLRYPGGSLANTYDWHKAVGPVASRGDWHFGIDEYITTCRAIGAEPQFIVSDYTGTPKDAAGLVEYLNAPAVPGHPWAMLRARGGHVPPYRVRWFELGNETDNGGGWPRRTFSAEQYAAYANATIHAMRAVDPRVKIGIIAATGKPVADPWNPAVFRLAGPNADFVVAHMYAVGDDTTSPGDLVMRGCMASADQYRAAFLRLPRFDPQSARPRPAAGPDGIQRRLRRTHAALPVQPGGGAVLRRPDPGPAGAVERDPAGELLAGGQRLLGDAAGGGRTRGRQSRRTPCGSCGGNTSARRFWRPASRVRSPTFQAFNS